MSWFNHLESNLVLSENLEHLYTLEPRNATPGYRHSCVFILVCVHSLCTQGYYGRIAHTAKQTI